MGYSDHETKQRGHGSGNTKAPLPRVLDRMLEVALLAVIVRELRSDRQLTASAPLSETLKLVILVLALLIILILAVGVVFH